MRPDTASLRRWGYWCRTAQDNLTGQPGRFVRGHVVKAAGRRAPPRPPGDNAPAVGADPAWVESWA